MSQPADERRYLSTVDVARELRVNEHTARSYFTSGALRGSKTGPGGSWMTTRAALDAFVLGPDPAATPLETPNAGPDGLGPLETK